MHQQLNQQKQQNIKTSPINKIKIHKKFTEEQSYNHQNISQNEKNKQNYIIHKKQEYKQDKLYNNENKNEIKIDNSLKTQKKQKQHIQMEDNQIIFKSTVSQYEDYHVDSTINKKCPQQQNITQQKLQPIKNSQKIQKQQNYYEIQQQLTNKYTKCLKIANEYLKILRISYYLTLLRFIFIVIVYYNVDFVVPKPSSSQHTYIPNTNQTLNGTDIIINQNNININGNVNINKQSNKLYEPWNVMIYFLSGSIDMIGIIGYISAIRFLKAEIKVLENKQNIQNQRIKTEKRVIQRQRNRDRLLALQQNRNMQQNNRQIQIQIQVQNNQNQHEQEPQTQEIPPGIAQFANMRQRIIRIGKQSTYLSIYSVIRQYKYKNKDQAAAFKITKIMHITATFLFFGRMALIQQYQSEGKIDYQGNVWAYGPWKQTILWCFLTTAYLCSFQIDFYKLESSLGPYIKVQKFHFSKIYQIYQQFLKWRKQYSVFLKIGTFLACVCIITQLITTFLQDTDKLSMILFTKIILLFSGFISIKQNKKIISKSQNYLKQKTQQNTLHLSQKNNTSYQFQHNLQKMSTYKNLSHLGILKHHCSENYYKINVCHRIALFIFGLAILRDSDTNNIKIYGFCINIVVFLAFFIGEMWKFYTVMNSHLNLLNSCKYKYMNLLNQQGKSQIIHKQQQISQNQNTHKIKKLMNQQIQSHNPMKNKQHNRKYYSKNSATNVCCSVCLNQYQAQQNVIIVCCGHIFHEDCLLDWLKQKKQCPLCRLNIQEYYEQISF